MPRSNRGVNFVDHQEISKAEQTELPCAEARECPGKMIRRSGGLWCPACRTWDRTALLAKLRSSLR